MQCLTEAEKEFQWCVCFFMLSKAFNGHNSNINIKYQYGTKSTHKCIPSSYNFFYFRGHFSGVLPL